MSNVLEKLNDALLVGGLDLETDPENDVPIKLREMLALINEVDEAKLKSDLAGAVRRAYNPLSVTPFDRYEKVDEDDPPGRPSGDEVLLEDIITLESKRKPAITVGDLINDAQALQGAMARLIDQYIRLVVTQMVKEESLTVAGGGRAEGDVADIDSDPTAI